jgi:hypothetical protein
MPRSESTWDRRMRENRTSGGTRGEEIVHAWYADIEPQPGKPRNRCRPKPKLVLSLVYSTLTTTPVIAPKGLNDWHSCMPRSESMWDRRMRENCTSGGRRSEAAIAARYADIEPQPGKPRNRRKPKPKQLLSLAYSTLFESRTTRPARHIVATEGFLPQRAQRPQRSGKTRFGQPALLLNLCVLCELCG